MKVTKTYSIEESIYNAFDYLTTEKKINKSSFIEDLIRKYLKDNDMDFIDKLYFLKSNPEHVVSVVSQDVSFYQLNDGSRINKILFMTIFDDVTPVEPDAFLNSSNKVFEELTQKIKNIDFNTKLKESDFDKLINKLKDDESDYYEKIKKLKEDYYKIDNEVKIKNSPFI